MSNKKLDVSVNRGVLIKRSEKLVIAARSNAVAAFTAILKKYPLKVSGVISDIDEVSWDFFMTAASVWGAMMRIGNKKLPDETVTKLSFILAKTAEEFDVDLMKAVEDCSSFVDRSIEGPREEDKFPVVLAAAGMWVFWNVFGRSPEGSQEEELSGDFGVLAVHPFIDWWV